MSKVRLYGNTSGYVDLQAPDVAGDVTITLPNESGPFATETYVDSAVASAGGLVAVKHALFTGTQSASVVAGANVAITDLSISHAITDASHKLIISAYMGIGANSRTVNEIGLAVAANGTLIGIGNADGSRTLTAAGSRNTVTGGTDVGVSRAVTFVYQPPSTSSITYTVRAVNIEASTRTLYINRTELDTNNTSFPRGSSALVIQEVKV
jgi:hypothetical protein